LCGACYEVCPVKINIPEILIHLRGKVVESGAAPLLERFAMKTAAFVFSSARRLSIAQKLARIGQRPFERDGVLRNLPGAFRQWTAVRDFPAIPQESFREWWAKRIRGN